ncbi:MAG: hypothetical protein ACK6EB_25950, partial [Planctomyces sp.]
TDDAAGSIDIIFGEKQPHSSGVILGGRQNLTCYRYECEARILQVVFLESTESLFGAIAVGNPGYGNAVIAAAMHDGSACIWQQKPARPLTGMLRLRSACVLIEFLDTSTAAPGHTAEFVT